MLLFYVFRLTDEINEGKHGITAPPAGLSKKQESLLNSVPAYDECVQKLQRHAQTAQLVVNAILLCHVILKQAGCTIVDTCRVVHVSIRIVNVQYQFCEFLAETAIIERCNIFGITGHFKLQPQNLF